MSIYYHITYTCVFFSFIGGHFTLNGDKKAKFVTKNSTVENLRPSNLMMGYDSFLQLRCRSTSQQNVAHPYDEIELESQETPQFISSTTISVNGNATVEDELYKELPVSSSLGFTTSLIDNNLNNKSSNLIQSCTQRKSPTSSSKPVKLRKRKNHQNPIEHKTKNSPTAINESYFSCSSPTSKFCVYTNNSSINTKQTKDNDHCEKSALRIIQTRRACKTKEALKPNHVKQKLENNSNAKNFDNDMYLANKQANDTITKVVETLTASLTKQKLKRKKRKRINSSKRHQRYISALNGNISPPSDADELGKKYN